MFCTPTNRAGFPQKIFTGPNAEREAWEYRRRLSIRGVAGGWFDIFVVSRGRVRWTCYCGDSGCSPGKCINRPA